MIWYKTLCLLAFPVTLCRQPYSLYDCVLFLQENKTYKDKLVSTIFISVSLIRENFHNRNLALWIRWLWCLLSQSVRQQRRVYSKSWILLIYYNMVHECLTVNMLTTCTVCFMLYTGAHSTKGLSGDLPDFSVLRMTEVYKDFPATEAPMIYSIGISCEVPLVDSAPGKVQAGCPLSYQQPVTAKRVLSFHSAPPPPSLPLMNYRLLPSSCVNVCSEPEQLHLKCLDVTWDMAHKLECATLAQSSCTISVVWLRWSLQTLRAMLTARISNWSQANWS